MENRRPVVGEFYRHFKGNLYQILTIGKHSETLEEMVVYQALYGTFDIYIRPLKQFVDTVDMLKYPNATQKYRFEHVIISSAQNAEQMDSSTCVRVEESKELENKEAGYAEKVEKLFFDFLDAETSKEKMEILGKMKDDLDLRIVNNIAASMDLPVDEDDVERQYEFIMQNLKQRSKFECNRLR